MTEPLASMHAIRRAAAHSLGDQPASLPELARRLAEAGVVLGHDPEDRVAAALEFDSRFTEVSADRWIHVPSVLHGTTWSAMVDADMADAGVVPADPDLMLLSGWAIESPIELADGSGVLEAVELDLATDALSGPPGWLAASAGATLLVHVADGKVSLDRADSPPLPTVEQVAAIRVAFAQEAFAIDVGSELADQRSIEVSTAMLDELLWEAVLADHDAFVDAPVPPVDLLLHTAELERDGVTVAEAGTDWEAWARWRARNRVAEIHDLDPESAEGLLLVLGVAADSVSGEPDPLGTGVAAPSIAVALAMYLSDDRVARASFGELVQQGAPPDRIAAFARLLLGYLDDDAFTAGVRWVLARALDHEGDAEGAEGQLLLATALDADFLLARRSLAAFASDRGDTVRALELLRDADVDDEDELLLEILPYAFDRPRASVGRNEPCPCGSGRKYKVCHLGRERHPLVDRAPWLYHKARRYLHDGRSRMIGAQIATIVAETSGELGSVLELLESELVDDLALCEAGVFDDFVAERDAFLPDDEALLAARWSMVERSLFEVERVGHDEMALRDLRTGDRVTVTNVTAHDAGPGQLLLGRPLPVDDTWRALPGFVRVPDSMRDDVLGALDDPDPFALAELIGRTFAPPTVQNTDREPMVFHELRYSIPDPTAAADVLRASELVDDGAGSFSLARDTAGQPRSIIVSMQLDRDELVVTVNSDRRAVEARELVARLLPDAVLEDDDVRSLDKVLRDPRTDPDWAERVPDVDEAAAAAVLAEYLREHERRWVDEPVPALGGKTPRQAAQDPIGRVELDHLLRSFEARGPSPNTFDVGRLRALLDMT